MPRPASLAPIVLVLAVVASCDAGSRSPDAPDTPQIPTSTSPSPAELLPLITGGCCAGLALEPGRYETPSWFGTPFTVEVGRGLAGVGDEQTLLLMIGKGRSAAGNLDHYVAIFAVKDADAIFESFRRTPKVDVERTRSFEAGELSGSVAYATARPNPGGVDDDEIAAGAVHLPALDRLTPAFFYTETPEAAIRIVAVENGSSDLVFYIEAPKEDFDAFAADVDEILSSISVLDT